VNTPLYLISDLHILAQGQRSASTCVVFSQLVFVTH